MSDQSSATSTRGTVHLVEDDDSARDATARFLRAAGFEVRSFVSAEDFLASRPAPTSGCVVLDLNLPGSSGLDLQEVLASSADPLPVVFLTGQGGVPDSVKAMKSGAVDFLTKTTDGEVLLEAIERALARDAEGRRARTQVRSAQERFDRLTAREREVFAHLISGQLNKQVGFDLGISERTIKIHRHHVLEKLEADSIADLVRIAAVLGVSPEGKVR